MTTTAPKRIQRKREAGWRMPPDTISVDRGGRFGNPFKVPDDGPEPSLIVGMFRAWLGHREELMLDAITELKGKDLACWCGLCDKHKDGLPLGTKCKECAPCHADVLLEVANAR